jgi:hypothetical protein
MKKKDLAFEVASRVGLIGVKEARACIEILQEAFFAALRDGRTIEGLRRRAERREPWRISASKTPIARD